MYTPPTDAINIDANEWHRKLCFVTPNIAVSGDLDTWRGGNAIPQLRGWVDAGITDIIDVREEHTDAEFVAAYAPHIKYHYFGTHDSGYEQDLDWFDNGVNAALTALEDPNRKIVIHCHMGINRAPSMTLALLLSLGYSPMHAMSEIRRARPIAAMLYWEDALRWHHKRSESSLDALITDLADAAAWHENNPLNVYAVISRIRMSE